MLSVKTYNKIREYCRQWLRDDISTETAMKKIVYLVQMNELNGKNHSEYCDEIIKEFESKEINITAQ